MIKEVQSKTAQTLALLASFTLPVFSSCSSSTKAPEVTKAKDVLSVENLDHQSLLQTEYKKGAIWNDNSMIYSFAQAALKDIDNLESVTTLDDQKNAIISMARNGVIQAIESDDGNNAYNHGQKVIRELNKLKSLDSKNSQLEEELEGIKDLINFATLSFLEEI